MKPNLIIIVAMVLSGISAMVVFFLNKDILKPNPVEKAEFTSVEFDADDTSYSPAETHSMNQLSKELTALRKNYLIVKRNWMHANLPSLWKWTLWRSKR